MSKVIYPLEYKKDTLKMLLMSKGHTFTRIGIARYQYKNNLPITGVIDFVTAQKLEEVNNE